MDIPDDVAAAQRAADQAWKDLEDHRKAVDEKRQADPRVEPKPGVMVVRPWTDDENTTHEKLRRAVIDAAEARRAVMQRAGIVSTYEFERDIRVAAHAGGEA